MSKIKNALDEILNCQMCDGKGISNYWSAPDGEYDFEWCECNPFQMIIDNDGDLVDVGDLVE